ncbi:multidrug effflux MFS transporter [Silanimonas sp.]|uniref:multidrug effflux MFS transporter n=1 Tax=Silanimonas sp. TaxID=1929290 RepID=UPI0022C1141C|nr:multidrug effflux MFS transporter [Silanimonas sp.]MCZ8165416.1 multidrug effflux MFS transporter [Silanimonas sp.]
MTSTATASRARLAFVLGALAMFGPFSIDTVFPAFGAMADDLGSTPVAVQQTISSYLLGYGLMSLFHGAISDAVGRRPVILWGTALFGLASVGCALSTDLTTLLVFRFIQGLCAGVGMIVGRAVIRDVFDGEEAQRLMSQVSMIFSIAPAIAPIVGGWILGFGDWHAIFWFLAVLSLVLGALVWRVLPETHPPERRLPLHAGLLMGNYVAMIQHRRFVWLVAVTTMNFAALFLYIASAPVVVMTHLGMGESDFGWFFVPVISGMLAGAWATGRAAGRFAARTMVMAGFACCLVAALANLAYAAMAPGYAYPWAILPLILLSFGVALVFPQLMLQLLDLYPTQRGSASSMQAFLSLMFQAGVAGLLSPMLSVSPLFLAIAAAALSVSAFGLWRWGDAHLMRRAVAPA